MSANSDRDRRAHRTGLPPSLVMPWMYLAAAAGVLVLLRIVFALVSVSERVATKAEEREKHRGFRERLDQFSRSP